MRVQGGGSRSKGSPLAGLRARRTNRTVVRPGAGQVLLSSFPKHFGSSRSDEYSDTSCDYRQTVDVGPACATEKRDACGHGLTRSSSLTLRPG
jgi:hypothetical protein